MKLTASFGVKLGPPLRPTNFLAEHAELDGQLVAFIAAGEVRRCPVGGADLTVGKDGGVELRRLAGFAVVEPQAGNRRALRHSSSLFRVDDEERMMKRDSPPGVG